MSGDLESERNSTTWSKFVAAWGADGARASGHSGAKTSTRDLAFGSNQLTQVPWIGSCSIILRILCIIVAALVSEATVHTQLAVTVSPPKVLGQKALVPLALRNGLPETVASARAVVFLVNEEGKMVGQGTRWVIGGTGERSALAPGATNSSHFLITGDKPFSTTNLTPKVTVTRLVLKGGRLADPRREAIIQYSKPN